MTQNALDLLSLFAARELPRVWGRFDHQRPASGAGQLLIVVGMAAVAAAAVLLWLLVKRRPTPHFVSNSPPRLFRVLCHAHGLRYATRRLLKRLASARGLATPSLLFVEPRHFDTSNLPPDLQSAAQDLHRLRDQLFG